MSRHKILAVFFLLTGLVLAYFSARSFRVMQEPEKIIPGQSVVEIRSLSDYFKGIAGTHGDTPVYILQGTQPGGTIVILGGTHPDEPASMMTAITLIENLKVTSGRLFIIPRANNSGFSHNDPQEANPQRFFIQTKSGERWFRYGSRITNPIDQWPDPEVYEHYPSGQKLSGSETRNLNRAYPGRPSGTLTEKVAYAIMQLMKQEKADLAIDVHEASLEYPVVNAIVCHPLAYDLAGEAVLNLQMEGLEFSLEPSPENFRGLSHREWGDHLQIPAILMESASTMHGRYHGKKVPELVLTGKDAFYLEAAQHELLEVAYPEQGIPLKERVGRHLASIKSILEIWSEQNPEKSIVVENVPGYAEMQEKGIGAFLN